MEPFLGQLMLVGFNFAPYQWALAEGQILAIQSNTALFSLLGTNFGGNGTSNFALPNLQGRVPLGSGQSSTGTLYDLGQEGGTEAVTLTNTTVPSHNHTAHCDATPALTQDPTGHAFAASTSNVYSDKSDVPVPMSPSALTPFQGGNLPHNNMMPFLSMNWIIALNGIFPQRQ